MVLASYGQHFSRFWCIRYPRIFGVDAKMCSAEAALLNPRKNVTKKQEWWQKEKSLMGVNLWSKAQKILKMHNKSPYGLIVKVKALQLFTSGAVAVQRRLTQSSASLMRPYGAQLDWSRTGPATAAMLLRPHSRHPMNSVTRTNTLSAAATHTCKDTQTQCSIFVCSHIVRLFKQWITGLVVLFSFSHNF